MTPEQALTDAHATFARLTPTLRAMFARAAASYPGPRAQAAGGGGAQGTAVFTHDDEFCHMTSDERRAIYGADTAEQEVHAAVRKLKRITKDLERIDALLAPYRPAHTTADPNDVPDDWCPNCYRNGQHHSPTKYRTRNGDTVREWADGLCSWCGNFRQARGWLPTKPLVERHHSPLGRVTDDLIDRVQRGLPRDVKQQIREHEKAKAKAKAGAAYDTGS